MSASMILIVSVATFFNFMILRYKFEHERIADGILDAGVFAAIVYLTIGSVSGLIIGMVSSALFSLYGLWKPFNLDNIIDDEDKDSLECNVA